MSTEEVKDIMDKTVNVQKRVLQAGERSASALRDHFAREGTLVLNLISSPGSGKTTLLESTIRALGKEYKMGALEGDIATERDADRLRDLGIPAYQILTGGACHLDPRQVDTALKKVNFGRLDLLFIENVGNLICPTSYDLGEDVKVALLSVTEGDDKPFKYPAIFSRAGVTVITKVDLLPHVSFRMKEVREQVSALNPDGRLFLTSMVTGEGIAEWCAYLRETIEEKRRRSK